MQHLIWNIRRVKLLIFQARAFTDSPTDFDLHELADEQPQVVVFVHAQPADGDDESRVVRKAVKQVKWVAGKRGLRHVVLHSFAHLAQHKASPEVAGRLLDLLSRRLANAGLQVRQTPFGQSLAWQLSVYQDSLAKVFVSIDARP